MCPGYGYGMLLQQAAKLHMTPKLRQAIRILQLPTPDLLETIRQELEQNPVLEAVDLPWIPVRRGPSGFDPLQHAAVPAKPTLERHLEEQLGTLSGIAQPLKRIVRYLIGNVDPNGYLVLPLERIAEDLRIDLRQVETALRILQGFEPAGVGARSLAECLLLQAQAMPRCPELVTLLIRNHLEDLAKLGPAVLAKRLEVPLADLRAAYGMIRSLNPRPGDAFQPADISYVMPDVRIERDGEFFSVTVLDAAAPRLTVHERYRAMARENGTPPEARKFLASSLNSASFLIKCIERRRQTLWRVTRAIVEEQADFFHYGVSRLKPLVLRQIADRVGMHESTVSRAAAGKYAQTPWGVFELGDFFPSGFNQGREDAASAASVKERIRERIQAEDVRAPFSDQALADLLAEEGIPVARRTVAKYREELGIASSVRRKAKF
ncbi:RNA polymerase factor sigma-54 [Cohnella sp. CFH 77786]|uniref:RNA polymerase factor sigma-54 n=1 Tax=Cohnella sp. CFH 77786 TaxID=2662265 RepID=UPI00210652D0|nr:RNA polymerase factor sigma-54 [Cohnella sp. CFH 77786]